MAVLFLGPLPETLTHALVSIGLGSRIAKSQKNTSIGRRLIGASLAIRGRLDIMAVGAQRRRDDGSGSSSITRLRRRAMG